MKHICLLAVVWVSLLTGCTTPKPGKVLDPSVVNHLHVGQKRNDVLALIGQPTQTHLGKTTVRDAYWVIIDRNDRESGTLHARYLTIVYDGKDVLLKSHYSERLVPIDSKLREIHIGQKLPADILSRITPRITKSSELIEWLGQPLYTILDIDGNLAMVWGGMQESRFVGIENKMLEVSVDDSGVVIVHHLYGFEHYYNPPAKRKTWRLSGWR